MAADDDATNLERIAGLSAVDCGRVAEEIKVILARFWKRAGVYTLEWRE